MATTARDITNKYPAAADIADLIMDLGETLSEAGGGKVDGDILAGYVADVINFESRFDPSVKNPASSATGLIQFLNSTAKKLGTTTTALAKMTRRQQFPYVAAYFNTLGAGNLRKIETFADVAAAVFNPSLIGKDPNTPLPKSMQKANPGIKSMADYVKMVERSMPVDESLQVAQAEVPTKSDYTRGPLPNEITTQETYGNLPPADFGADQTDSFPSVPEEENNTITEGGGQDTLEGRGNSDSLNEQTDDLLVGSTRLKTLRDEREDSNYRISSAGDERELLATPHSTYADEIGNAYTENERSRTGEAASRIAEEERLSRIADFDLSEEESTDGDTPIGEILRNFFNTSDDETQDDYALRTEVMTRDRAEEAGHDEASEEQNLHQGGSVEQEVNFGKDEDVQEEKELPDPPPGATPEEVADDIPAYLSTGEYVLPANVVRYIGLKSITGMHQRVLHELQQMEDLGIINNVDHNGEIEDDDDEMVYKKKDSKEMEGDIHETIIISARPQGLMKPAHYADGGDVWVPGVGFVNKKKGIDSNVQDIEGYKVPQDHRTSFKDVPQGQDASWETEEESRYVGVPNFSDPGWGGKDPFEIMWEGGKFKDKNNRVSYHGGAKAFIEDIKSVIPGPAGVNLVSKLKDHLANLAGQDAGSEFGPIGGWRLKGRNQVSFLDKKGNNIPGFGGFNLTNAEVEALGGQELDDFRSWQNKDSSGNMILVDTGTGGQWVNEAWYKDQTAGEYTPTYNPYKRWDEISSPTVGPDTMRFNLDWEKAGSSPGELDIAIDEANWENTDYYDPPEREYDDEPFGGKNLEFSKGGSVNKLAPGGMMYNPASGFRALAASSDQNKSTKIGRYNPDRAERHIIKGRDGDYDDFYVESILREHNVPLNTYGGDGGPAPLNTAVEYLQSGSLKETHPEAVAAVHDLLERRANRSGGGLQPKQVYEKFGPDVTNREALQYYFGADLKADQRYSGGNLGGPGIWPGDVTHGGREHLYSFFESPESNKSLANASKTWNSKTGMTYNGGTSVNLDDPYSQDTVRKTQFFLRFGQWPKSQKAWDNTTAKWDAASKPKASGLMRAYNPAVGYRDLV